MNRNRAAVVVVIAGLLLGACGGGSTGDESSGGQVATTETPSGTPGTGPTAEKPPWSFGEDDHPLAEGEKLEADPATADMPSAQGNTGEVQAAGMEGPVFDGQEIAEQDPCSLLEVGEWAAWRQVTADRVSSRSLEYRTACGYLTDDDTIRVALAVMDRNADGSSWLAAETETEAVSVAGNLARWARRHPVPESSVLVVDLGKAELVLEISSRHNPDEPTLRDGAIELATIAAGRHAR